MAALDNIASELLKSANEADLIFKKTRDQAQRDKAVRLRRIVENLKLIIADGLTPTLDEVLAVGNTSTNSLNVGGITSDYFQLDTAATPTLAPGMFAWNDAYGTADLRLKGNNVTLQLGQETLARVVNKTGSDLLESQYKVVRVRVASEGGAQGQRLAVVLAQGLNDPESATTLGIVTENIANNQEGFITVFGNVNNINTTGSLQGETWVDGDVLYLSPTTAGGLTKVKPVAPNHMVIIGYVVYAHANNGKIFVKVDNGYELDELHNVLINGVANNDLLQYDSATQVWKNKTISAIFGGTPLVSVPTLQQVTTAGYTTTNPIIAGQYQIYGTTRNARLSSDNVGGFDINYNIGGTPDWRWFGGGTTALTTFKANGNVLIGTTTDAGYKLDVAGTINGQGIYSRGANIGMETQIAALGTSGSYRAGYYLGSTNTNYVARLGMSVTNGDAYISLGNTTALTDVMYFKSSGNIGIGNTAPQAQLQVGSVVGTGLNVYSFTGYKFGVENGTSRFIGPEVTASNQSTTIVDFVLGASAAWSNPTGLLTFTGRDRGNNVDSGVLGYIGIAKSTSANSIGSGNLIFGTAPDLSSTSAERMRITAAGNVGIGTNAPQVKLEVRSTQNNTIAPANAVAKFVGNDAGIFIGTLAGVPNYGSYLQSMRESDALAFAMHLNPLGGNVLIGTTTDSGYKLDINGTLRVQNIPAGATSNGRFLVQASAGGVEYRTAAQMLSDIDVPGYVSSRGENLVTNGTGLRKSNYNFSAFTFVGSDAYYTTGSFRDTNYSSSPTTDEAIPVDVNQRYRLTVSARQNPYVGARYYIGVSLIDADGLPVNASHHMYKANTLTTLAAPLNPGDTVVYLTSAANWENGGTAGVNTHLRSFIFWNYTNSLGYTFPALTYSRNWHGNMWDPGSVNTTTNTITLRVPWPNSTVPAGTQLSNGSSGGTYKYITAGNVQIPNAWTTYTGTISGVDTTGTNQSDKFAPGTAAIKILFLNNRDVAGATVYYTNVQFALDLQNPLDQILNQNAVVQTANFSISGTGYVGTRLGVGAASSSRVLTVGGDILLNTNNVGLLGKSTGGSDLEMFKIDNSNNIQFGTPFNGAGSIFYAGTLTDWYQYPSSVLTHRMRLSANGNLLIGTTTDAGYKLDVIGTARVQSSVSNAVVAGLRLANSAAASVTAGQGVQLDFANDSGFALSLSSSTIRSITTNTANGGADLLFLNYSGSALTEYMRITRLGSVGIGTTSPSASLHVASSVTAASAIARGVNFSQTLTASANNDVLVGLDIAPTFTNGAFTGISRIPFRAYLDANSWARYHNNIGSNYHSFEIRNDNAAGSGFASIQSQVQTRINYMQVYTPSDSNTLFGVTRGGWAGNISENVSGMFFGTVTAADVIVGANNTATMRIFNSTRNVVFQNGGTFTDAGYRLDVQGTARIQSDLTVASLTTDGPVKSVSGMLVSVAGYTGSFTVPTNPPGMQTLDIQDGIIVNIL